MNAVVRDLFLLLIYFSYHIAWRGKGEDSYRHVGKMEDEAHWSRCATGIKLTLSGAHWLDGMSIFFFQLCTLFLGCVLSVGLFVLEASRQVGWTDAYPSWGH
jgi:hypothetical protein